jgi:cytochrome oxidase assembly protein ShyY1
MRLQEGKKHTINVNRLEKFSKQPVDITPSNNERRFLWSKSNNLDEFEADFTLKKVKIKGIFDHNKEIQVEKNRDGEKGVEIVTPFYTHLNEKGEECGILVNRGWVPLDFKDMKMHYTGISSGEVIGFLYRGDAKTKYSLPNEPTIDRYTRVDPYDFSLITQMNNREEAS